MTLRSARRSNPCISILILGRLPVRRFEFAMETVTAFLAGDLRGSKGTAVANECLDASANIFLKERHYARQYLLYHRCRCRSFVYPRLFRAALVLPSPLTLPVSATGLIGWLLPASRSLARSLIGPPESSRLLIAHRFARRIDESITRLTDQLRPQRLRVEQTQATAIRPACRSKYFLV